MYLVINKCVTSVNVSNFSGHYLRNRSTLDIGVLGYICILVISVYFNIRNTLPKSGTFLLGHPVYPLAIPKCISWPVENVDRSSVMSSASTLSKRDPRLKRVELQISVECTYFTLHLMFASWMVTKLLLRNRSHCIGLYYFASRAVISPLYLVKYLA